MSDLEYIVFGILLIPFVAVGNAIVCVTAIGVPFGICLAIYRSCSWVGRKLHPKRKEVAS